MKANKKSLRQKIKGVFLRVHGNFKYISDERQYGKIDDWRMPDDYDHVKGDCDDHAMACRGLLRREGIKTRLVICKTETGEWHMVCTAGNYVLDNRHHSVRTIESLERTGYLFYFVSGLEPGDPWSILHYTKK